MCGRINLGAMTAEELSAYFEWGIVPERLLPPWQQRFNVPPTTLVPILRSAGEVLQLNMARWGLIPGFHRGGLRDWKATSFNARVETVATSPAFRDAYRARNPRCGRCVQPAAGFYEWLRTQGGKTPFYIHSADAAPALMFAALWTEVRLSDYEGLTAATLTEPAHPRFAQLHDRQPVMLDRAGMVAWLAGAPIDEVPRIDIERIDWHEVSQAVNSVRNDGPDLIRPVD